MPPSKLQPTTFLIRNQLTTVNGGAPYWDISGQDSIDFVKMGTNYAYEDSLKVWATAHNVRLVEGGLFNGSGWGQSFYTYVSDTTVGGAGDGLRKAWLGSCQRHGCSGIEIDCEYPPNSDAYRKAFDVWIRRVRADMNTWNPKGVIMLTCSSWWLWSANPATPEYLPSTVANVDYILLMLYNMEKRSMVSFNAPLHQYPGGPAGGYGSLNYWDDGRTKAEYYNSGVPANKMVFLTSGEVKYFTGSAPMTPGSSASEQGGYHSMTEFPANYATSANWHWNDAAQCSYYSDGNSWALVPEGYASMVAKVNFVKSYVDGGGNHLGGIGVYDVGRWYDSRQPVPDSAMRGLVTITGGGPPPPPPTYKLKGQLYFDKNSNGTQDANEPGLSGWTVHLTGPISATQITNSAGQYLFDSLTAGNYQISQDVRAQWRQTFPANNGSFSFTVPNSSGDGNFGNFATSAIPITINKNWNILSLPATVADNKISTLLPTATSEAFSYLGAYAPSSNLFPGLGYWIRFGFNQTEYILGQPLLTDTIALNDSDWNLIGSVGHPVAVSSIQTDPPGILDSKFYGFNNGVTLSDTIQRGLGYWIKLSAPGSIIFPATTAQQYISQKETADFSGMNSITFLTAQGFRQTLYFGENRSVPGLESEYKLPPAFPGVFHAQFSGYAGPPTMMRVIPQITGGVFHMPVALNSVDFPLTVRIHLPQPGVYSYALSDNASSYPLADGSETVLQGDSTAGVVGAMTLSLTASTSSSTAPSAYALAQNYPNPFNPGTAINFDLPQTSRVRLEVFNLLGEKVATLVDRDMNGGYYSVPFDGSRFSSGVYYYRLLAQDGTANPFQQIRKMLLVK